jgi:uncharacterized protein YndB with AHSA1/START domain
MTGYNVEVTRTVPAPVATAYAAWTDSDLVRRWWGPTGFTCPVARMDVREGGVSLVAMRAPAEFGGGDLYNTWTYTRVVPPARLEYTLRFCTSDGTTISPAEAGVPGDVPDAVPHVVTFEALDDTSCRISVTEYGYPDPPARDMSRAGLEQCLDKLAKALVTAS